MADVLKFLDPYNKDDIRYYFGRNTETDILYEKVKNNPITLFYGLSGTGKTSMLLCGLANRFDEVDWLPFVIRRGSNTDILDATLAVLRNCQPGAQANSTKEKTTAKICLGELDRIYNRRFLTTYLIFDQLEELFIYGDAPEKKAFIRFLVDIKEEKPFVKIILVTREEFFVHLDDFETEIPEIFKSRFRLQPMRIEDSALPDDFGDFGQQSTELQGVKSIIPAMANALGLEMSPDIVGRVIEQIKVRTKGTNDSDFNKLEKKIELPYLQIYFRELVKNMQPEIHRAEGKRVPVQESDLPKLGSVNDVLTDYLVKCVEEISKEFSKDERSEELMEKTVWQALDTLVSYRGTKQIKTFENITEEINT